MTTGTPRRRRPWSSEFEKLVRSYLPLLGPDEPLGPDLRLIDHGLDSVASVSLLIDLEDRFVVSVPDELLATMFESAGNLWAVVEQLLPEREPS